MIAVVELSATKFSLNGIPYLKNFLSTVSGNNVRIVNQYDSAFQLLPFTDYSEVSVNGMTYASAAELQTALLPVLFTRNSLAGVVIDGNITSIEQVGDTVTFILADDTEFVLNLAPYNQAAALANHIADQNNPHSVTKAQAGLGNVDNTSDANKPISDAQATVNANKADKSAVAVDINSAGSKAGLYVFGKKAGINEGELIGFWKVKPGVSNPATDDDFEEPLGMSQ